MNWHTLTIAEVLTLLESSAEGLTTPAAQKGIGQWGPNELEEGREKSRIAILLSQFKDVMIIILLASAVIAGVVGDVTDAIVILVIVLLNALLGYFQEYRAGKAIAALKKMSVAAAHVIRDGQPQHVPASALAPGDVVLLEAGDAVPADIRLMESHQLRVDEAALTGESVQVEKIPAILSTQQLDIAERSNMVFKGTYISTGRAKGIVVATGMHTELGNIARMLEEKETLTPLQQRMASFGKKLSLLILVLCGLFFLTEWLRGEDLLRMLLTSISMAVAAIPEALPAVIAISLALAAKRMVKSQCLVRRLPAVETLGSVTCICTDKTGTLTRNKMQLVEVYKDGKMYAGDDLFHLQEDERGRLLLQAFQLNNDALTDSQHNITGDSTEVALKEAVRSIYPQMPEIPRVTEIAFDADRKMMTTFHTHEGKIIAFTKGAPDLLLERTVGEDRGLYRRQVAEMAAKGQRVLGFAYRVWDDVAGEPDSSVHETGLHFLGLAGMIDPPRPEVRPAVEQCRTAGILPVIITGDHPLTSKAIAEQTGIITGDEDKVITGREMGAMTRQQLAAASEKIRVYARVSPEQKLDIVKMLQEKGHYVAMTGDGVNDAPSLKRADIGIAMGITGTDVARQAADMILLDDNFATIVSAVREGRRVYDNMLKFIKYLMTSNTGELATLLLGPVIGLPIALLPIHILWINLVTDGMPAISLSFEKAEGDVLRRPPRPPKESVFASGRGLHMIWVGLFMAAVALAVQKWSIIQGWHWQTIVFNVICLSQMGHVLAVRSSRPSVPGSGVLSNRPLLASVGLVFVLQLAVTYLPVLQPVFRTQTLGWKEFLLVGITSSLVFVVVELQKGFFVRRSGK